MTSTTVNVNDCEMCFTNARRATRTEFFQVFDTPYQVRLCKMHQQKFLNDMSSWMRIATVVDDLAVPQPRKVQPKFTDEHTQRIRELQERAAANAPTRTVIAESTSRPSSPDEWRFVKHAQERAEERGFSPEVVLAAASRPETVYPEHRRGVDFSCHLRQGCYVVVNTKTKVIITVMDKMMFHLERDEFSNAAASA